MQGLLQIQAPLMQRDAQSAQLVAFHLLVLSHAQLALLDLTLEQLVHCLAFLVRPVPILVLGHHLVYHVVLVRTQLSVRLLVRLAPLAPIQLEAYHFVQYVQSEVILLLERHLVLHVLSACLQ